MLKLAAGVNEFRPNPPGLPEARPLAGMMNIRATTAVATVKITFLRISVMQCFPLIHTRYSCEDYILGRKIKKPLFAF
jgi:hypothetical protein